MRKIDTETAGHLAARNVPIAFVSDTAATVRRLMQSRQYETVDILTVVSAEQRYQGIVELGQLLRASDQEEIKSLMRADWPTVLPETDQEHAVDTASRCGVAALPVVDINQRPLGVISPSVLLDVLAREHREDVHRFAGILRERAGSVHALEDPPWQRATRRLPWLLVGLAMSAAATGVMASFEHTLQANVTIAFFIPALVYLADAIGTQTEMIAVRGLSLRRRPLLGILRGEMLVGGLIGVALGLIAFLAVWLVFGSAVIGLGVGVSLLVAGTLASTMGLLLPWVLSQLNIDPAFGSGPVATIIQDILTILIYFVTMSVLMQP